MRCCKAHKEKFNCAGVRKRFVNAGKVKTEKLYKTVRKLNEHGGVEEEQVETGETVEKRCVIKMKDLNE